MIFLIILSSFAGCLALSLFAYGLFALISGVRVRQTTHVKTTEPLSLSINGENLPIEEGVLLNTLWAHLPDAECKEGECGGCRVRLLSGDIEWIRKPVYKLDDETHFLPCSCRAKTSLVCELLT